MKITAKYKIAPEWIITSEAQDDGSVWFYVRTDGMGGLFMSPTEARDIAKELTDAAENAELLLATKEAA